VHGAIDLSHVDLALELGGELLPRVHHALAVTAPGGEELDEGALSAANHGLEGLGVQVLL